MRLSAMTRRDFSRITLGFTAAGLIGVPAVADDDPKDQLILKKLEQHVNMDFHEQTPLEDVLRYIRSATQGPGDDGIPIFVDPEGLKAAGATMTSPVTIDAEGVPLKVSLRALLKPLGLTYRVKGGLLRIEAK